MIELTKIHANAILRMMQTLRRLDLAVTPTGKYTDATKVFNTWHYAKKYGVVKNGKE